MTRHVERLEGLCLYGEAALAGATIRVPALLEAAAGLPPAPAAGRILLTERPGAPSGHRLLRLGTTPPLDLDLPVAAPEVSGTATNVAEVASGVLMVHGPVRADALSAASPGGASLVILSNGRQLFAEGDSFVRALEGIQTAFQGSPLLWTPRVALPHRIPQLTYLGVDLLDTTEGEIRSLEGATLDESLGEEAGRPDARAPSVLGEYQQALETTRRAIERGRLRELVESRLTAEPALAEILRYADRDLATHLEARAPVAGGAPMGRYVLAESLRRPEMRRFRDRLIERYRPPPSKAVLLLVPCSRTKPYRLSRSHRRFARAWEGQLRVERLHVVSVSSPIGLVPRELEDVYPARHYDIPVTGDWSENERELVRAGVRHLLREGHYRSVIVHLDPQEYGFVREALSPERPTVWTLGDDRSTSEEAISALRTAVQEAFEGLPAVPGGPLTVVREELREIASWQFGRAAAERLFAAPLRLLGRPWFQRLNDGAGTDLASWREERGLFHLTVGGAARVDGADALAVEADPRVPLTGDLFVPGVLRADPRIRIGDSVLVRQNATLTAVGEAALPGPLMTSLGHGLAVRVRHRAHDTTDRPLKGKGPAPPGPVV